jgi:putative salt-induced outer membrane protein
MIQKGLFLLFISMAVMAEETPIITHSEFSYINTKGNTNTTSLAFEGSAKKQWDQNIFRLHANMYKSTDNGKTSKDKWSSEFNYDYQICPRTSINYLIGYKEDRFSGFEYQFYSGPGMGIKAIDSINHKLDFQANILYGKDKPENLPSDGYFSSKLGANYRWQMLDNLKFIQEATYRVNLEDTEQNFFYSKTAIENKINSTLSMGVSYKIDYVNTPPPPSVKTDRTFLVSLIIDY